MLQSLPFQFMSYLPSLRLKQDFIFCFAQDSVPQYSNIGEKVTQSGGTFNVTLLFQSIVIFRDLSQKREEAAKEWTHKFSPVRN